MPYIIGLPGAHDEWFDSHVSETIPYHRMYGKQYCLPAFVGYEREMVDELRVASVQLDRIYWKAMRFVQRYLNDEILLRELGIHPQLLRIARMEVPHHAIARQDWIVSNGRAKFIEYNTDTPTGVPEVAWLASHILSRAKQTGRLPFDVSNPADEMENLIVAAFRKLIELYTESGHTGPLWFTCHDDHTEDRANTIFIVNLLRESGLVAEYAPLSSLQIVPNVGLFAKERRIEMLYRLYPLEYFPAETDSEGFAIGEAFIRLVEQGQLMLVNPSQSIVTQSKGMLALIWSLFERNQLIQESVGLRRPLFDEVECAAIERFMLPAYLTPTPFLEKRLSYVSKGFFGREGKGTTIHHADSSSTDTSRLRIEEMYYSQQPQLYQKYEPMQTVAVNTEQGEFEGSLLTGVFVIGRQFAGILPRIGEPVTGDMAYFCPAVQVNNLSGGM